jgi:hypothetical protein
MLKSFLSFSLIILLFWFANAMPVLAVIRADQEKTNIEKVKAEVAKRVGKKGKVKVKMRDGSKLTGSITQAGDDSFTLTDNKTGQTRVLAYGDVAQVKKAGGLSTLSKVGIGAGIAVGGLAILYAVFKSTCDDFGCP